MSDDALEKTAQAMASIVTEWFKAIRRLVTLTSGESGQRYERERAQTLYSRGQIETILAGFDMRMVTYDGSVYSVELPAEPVNPEDFSHEEGLRISETLEPTILHKGRVIIRGRIVLAETQ